MAAAFFIILAYLLAPKIHSWIKRELMIVICVLVVIAIGLSRIILNVHWFSDVIGGWSLGIFFATASILLVRYVGVLVIKKEVFRKLDP
jgi:undecaprenyl-diphosphatase